MIGHDGRSDSRSFREAAGIGAALEELAAAAGAAKPKQAAILHDWDNMWAIEGSSGPRNAGMGYWKELALHYNALSRAGIAVDFVDQTCSLEGYGLVVLPMAYLLREEFARAVCDFAQQGGTVVVTYWSGVVDESDLCRLGDTPYGLTKLLGLRRTEIDGMYDGETRRCVLASDHLQEVTHASTLCEVAALDEADPAEPLVLYGEDYFAGAPAVARHRYGKGRAYYLASRFEPAFYDAFYQTVARKAGLASCRPAALPEGVLAARRGELLFLQNCNTIPALLPDGSELPGYGTAVYKAGGMVRVL